VDAPEDVEQLLVGYPGGVVENLDDLGMARPVRADVPVRGVLGLPAGVADGGVDDAGNEAELRLDTPESAGPEGRLLQLLAHRPSSVVPSSSAHELMQ
jgi:hypothetical protein